jgi:tryptophan-rich sensory protein
MIGLNIYFFNKTSKLAAILLAPYFCWVAFASTLNLAIVVMN